MTTGPMEAAPLRVALGRALRRRCPRCGHGPLFTGWWRPHPVCAGCRIRPDRGEADYFLGALLVNFLVTEVAIAAVVAVAAMLTRPAPPWDLLRVAGLGAAVVVPVLAYPVARMIWLAVDLRFRPPILEGETGPPFDVS